MKTTIHTATIGQLRKQKAAFLKLRTVGDLADLLDIRTYQLQLLAINPQYHIFSIPKRNGKKRIIEDPVPSLKAVQRQLNIYLQSVYFFQRKASAFGFLCCPKRDPEPRTIVTNAEAHIGCQYMWNGDLKDFFHQVSFQKVFDVFSAPPFQMEKELIVLLCQISCNQKRLPMGAPTSPILSNFAALELDDQLENLAIWSGLTYTRFADDLSFSGKSLIGEDLILKIKTIVEGTGFTFNPKKFKSFDSSDVKMVTGLEVHQDKVVVPVDFIETLKKEMVKLDTVLELQYRSGRKSEWIDEFQEQVAGKLSFVTMVMGKKNDDVKVLNGLFEKALHIPEEVEPVGWFEFNYF